MSSTQRITTTSRKNKLDRALNALESAEVNTDDQTREQARLEALTEIRDVRNSL